MGHHEQDWLNNCATEFKPIHYLNSFHSDDTEIIFKDQSHRKYFLQYLNNKDSNIKALAGQRERLAGGNVIYKKLE